MRGALQVAWAGGVIFGRDSVTTGRTCSRTRQPFASSGQRPETYEYFVCDASARFNDMFQCLTAQLGYWLTR